MTIATPFPWSLHFCAHSPLFLPLSPVMENFSHCDQLPDWRFLQHQLTQQSPPIKTASNQHLQFVPQTKKSKVFNESYEARIYLTGEIQARHNWHDFFNALVWFTFPQTKAVINALHYRQGLQRHLNHERTRTALENTLTLFDESGAIILCSQTEFLHSIQNHDWKTLFWHQRKLVTQHLQCFIFGHGLYEKALNPYPGMTAQSILVVVKPEFFQWDLARQLYYADSYVAQWLTDTHVLKNSHNLQPFPLLGMPEWDKNNREEYYDNKKYFREKNQPRNRRSESR